MRKTLLFPRKMPRQRRSQATVELILEAATRVLSRESLAGFNTNRVAAVAGISVGSLYQYFPNKEALVTALIDRAQDELAAAAEVLLARHARELDSDLPASAAGDCLVMTKALVEADAEGARTAPADLEDRILRALRGYLARGARRPGKNGDIPLNSL